MVVKQIIPINPYVDSAILSHDPNLTMKTPRKQNQKPAKRPRGGNEGGKSEEDSVDESRFCYTAASKARRMCAWCELCEEGEKIKFATSVICLTSL